MNHTELTAALAKISDQIDSKAYALKLARQGITFILQTAREADLAPDRSRADSAKIRLAEAYIKITGMEYELEVLKDKQKLIKKSLTRLAA